MTSLNLADLDPRIRAEIRGNRSDAERMAALPTNVRQAIIAATPESSLSAQLYNWKFWGRKNQQIPTKDHTTWLLLAGRGFGKTRVGAEYVKAATMGPTPLQAPKGGARRIALVAETAADARDVMIEGDSGLLSIFPKEFRPDYIPSMRRLEWPNGAVAFTYNAVVPDQLRGPQHDLAWCDELAKFRYIRETWDNLQMGLRLGMRPRQVVSTTPRPLPVIREILEAPDTIVTRGSTYENLANLPASFIRNIMRRYTGTRIGRQELLAELLDDMPGALWTRDMLDAAVIRSIPALARIVVAIDPSGTAGVEDGEADDVGIIVAALGQSRNYVVLEDLTANVGPAEWARTAVFAYKRWNADLIVAEKNFGGDMVRHTIQTFDANVPVRMVTASRAKHVRAEPVSLLYEQRRVKHVGHFPQLGDELVMMTKDGYQGERSPNRADALVWAITELMAGAGDSGAIAAVRQG